MEFGKDICHPEQRDEKHSCHLLLMQTVIYREVAGPWPNMRLMSYWTSGCVLLQLFRVTAHTHSFEGQQVLITLGPTLVSSTYHAKASAELLIAVIPTHATLSAGCVMALNSFFRALVIFFLGLLEVYLKAGRRKGVTEEEAYEQL